MTVPSAAGEGGPVAGGEGSGDARRRREARRRRLDEIFGDVLPVTTADERDPADRSGFDADYYRWNRPPHHDR